MNTRRLTESTKRMRTGSIRTARGASLVELGAVAFLLPIVVFLCVNLGVLVFAAWINDAACKDAARAAASRSNQDDAFDAAVAVVGRYMAGGILGKPEVQLDHCEFNLQPDADGNPQQGGTTTLPGGPYVTISTQSNVNLPAPIVFNGNSLVDHMTFGASYTFPVLNPTNPTDDNEITVGNGPDINANNASAEEERLAQLAEAADEQAIDSAAKAEAAQEKSDRLAATAAQLDQKAAQSKASSDADPTNTTLKNKADRDADAAAKADAKAFAAAQEASDAAAKAAADDAAATAADQAVEAAAAAVEAAYATEPDEKTSKAADESAGDQDAGVLN